MKSELKKGIKRAAKNGNKLPVPALARNKSILSNDIPVKRFKNKTELFSEI
nr:Uncharacterized protein A9P81_0463 [Leptospira interrogans serovar Copenhageni/Icterohaemorrhagiae]